VWLQVRRYILLKSVRESQQVRPCPFPTSQTSPPAHHRVHLTPLTTWIRLPDRLPLPFFVHLNRQPYTQPLPASRHVCCDTTVLLHPHILWVCTEQLHQFRGHTTTAADIACLFACQPPPPPQVQKAFCQGWNRPRVRCKVLATASEGASKCMLCAAGWCFSLCCDLSTACHCSTLTSLLRPLLYAAGLPPQPPGGQAPGWQRQQQEGLPRPRHLPRRCE